MYFLSDYCSHALYHVVTLKLILTILLELPLILMVGS